MTGNHNDPASQSALDDVAKLPIQWESSGLNYFLYCRYYGIQGHYQAGDKYWNNWHPRVREMLPGKQNADGSWDVSPGTAENEGTVDPNEIYRTLMASLVLEIYMHFLPAYQG